MKRSFLYPGQDQTLMACLSDFCLTCSAKLKQCDSHCLWAIYTRGELYLSSAKISYEL